MKTFTVTELIERFLNSTDSSLPAIHRLIFLADVSHLGWSGMCEVYEHMLAIDLDPGGRQGSFGVWMGLEMAIMKDAKRFNLEDRVRVAADVEAVIERAARETSFCPETSLGYFYYEHPLRAEQPQVYLLTEIKGMV